jgi:hypothetical protein
VSNGKLTNDKCKTTPWSIFGKKSKVDNLWAEESNYAMALKAISLKRLQGSLEITELEHDFASLEEKQSFFDRDLY